MIKLQAVSEQHIASQAIVRKLTSHCTKLFISTHAGHQIIPKHDIAYIKADGNYCEIHLSNAQKIVCSKTLKDLSRRIDHPGFARVHQSYLVNLQSVVKVNSSFSELTLQNGASIPISRSNRCALKARMSTLFD